MFFIDYVYKCSEISFVTCIIKHFMKQIYSQYKLLLFCREKGDAASNLIRSGMLRVCVYMYVCVSGQ